MTEPAKYVHDAIAGKPSLKSGQNSQRNPHGKAKYPIGFRLWSIHLHLLSLNIPTLKGFVNG